MSAPRVFEPAYYERLAELERRHWWSVGMRVIAGRLLDRVRPANAAWRVLDAGCGTGLTLDWVRRYAAGAPVGMDLSPIALAHCRRGGQTKLAAGSATTLPFASASFDLVLSNDVLQHLPRPGGDEAFFAEAHRVLGPGGWLCVRTNSQCGLGPVDAADYCRYTLEQVRALATRAGFQVCVLSYVNCAPGAVEILRRRLAPAATRHSDPGLAMVVRSPQESLSARLLLAILHLEGWWVGRLGLGLPFGRSIVLLAGK